MASVLPCFTLTFSGSDFFLGICWSSRTGYKFCVAQNQGLNVWLVRYKLLCVKKWKMCNVQVILVYTPTPKTQWLITQKCISNLHRSALSPVSEGHPPSKKFTSAPLLWPPFQHLAFKAAIILHVPSLHPLGSSFLHYPSWPHLNLTWDIHVP